MARILLVDTNFSAAPIRDHLRRQGHDVWLVGGNANDFLARADPGWRDVDYSDARALTGIVDELAIDHVVPGCNDRSYLSCSEAWEHPAFTGIDPPETSNVINNKREFRRFAMREGLATPRLFDLDREKPAVPVIVKPVDAFSGHGVGIVMNPDRDLDAALATARQASASGECLVEELVSGQLYSHSAFLMGGRIIADFVVVEHCVANPFAVDTSYLVEDFSSSLLSRIRETICHVSRSLSLGDGLIHTQLILDGEQFWLIETTRRCPGDLYSLLIELSTGFPYAAAYASTFVGAPLPAWPHNAHRRPILRHTITSPEERTFEHLQFHHPLQLERFIPLAITGNAVEPAPRSRIALMFAATASRQELEMLAQHAVRRELYSFS